MNEIRKLAGQTVVYGFGTIVPRVLNYLILTPFFTRIFSPVEYGIFTELYSYVVFLLVLLTYGMETTFFRFSQEKHYQNRLYSTTLISILFTSVVFIVIIFTRINEISHLIGYENNQNYIKLFSLIVALDAFSSIPFAKLRIEEKAKKFAMIKIANVTVNILLNVIFYIVLPYLHQNYEWGFVEVIYNPDLGVGYAFIANLFASALSIVLLSTEIVSAKMNFDYKLWKSMMLYALPLLIVGLSGMINEVFDKIIMKYLVSNTAEPMYEVGIYGANYKLAVIMTLFIQMFRYAAEPFFFKKMKDKDAKQTYAKVMKLFIVFGLFIFLGVILFLDIIKFFIGKEFHEGLGIVPIVLIANLFLGIIYNLSVWYKLTNKTYYGAVISIMGAIITILLNIYLVPKIGYSGAAWATLVCYAVMMIVSYILGQKFYKIKYPLKDIVVYAIISACIYCVYEYFTLEGILKYVASSILIMGFVIFFIKKEKIYLYLKN